MVDNREAWAVLIAIALIFPAVLLYVLGIVFYGILIGIVIAGVILGVYLWRNPPDLL